MNTLCKPVDYPLSVHEQYVLGIIKPDEYTAAIIKAISISMDAPNLIGELSKLASVYPELCDAMACLIHGNLYKRYEHQKTLKELGY